jgi:2-hydroxy-6-oxonona-2,4-dienedioate hydrolase
MSEFIFNKTRRALLLIFASLFVFSASAASAQTAAPIVRADKEVRVYGQKIRYVEAGTGEAGKSEPVILLHGLGGNSSNWTLNINVLAARYRVIVPDQVGFGQSDKPMINYRVGTYVDFLDRLYSELKIERAVLVGNSMGGWIAALYAIAHPERVSRLVLVDAAGFAPPKDFDTKQLAALNPSTREGIRQLASLVFYNKQLYTSNEAVDFMLTQRMAAGDGYTIESLIASIARREDMLDGKLSAIKQPTLIIWGRQDGLTPLAEFGERFKREIPSAEFIIFEECGHVPMVEKATEFNTALMKFLAAPAR